MTYNETTGHASVICSSLQSHRHDCFHIFRKLFSSFHLFVPGQPNMLLFLGWIQNRLVVGLYCCCWGFFFGGGVFFPIFYIWKGEGFSRLTSTRSPPTTFSPLQPRMISSPCIEVSPPISGVPVPGAKAGSSPSMSNDIYTGLSPIISRTSLIRGARDLCQHSSAITTRNPWNISKHARQRLS